MNEVLFKFIFFIFFLNTFCYSENVSPASYDYVFNNYTSTNLSKNNVGIKYSFKNHESYFLTHNWISNNLYIGGYLGFNKNDKISYILNIGYKTNLNYFKKSKIIYDFSICNKNNFNDIKSKWKKISLIFDFNFLNLSYNYLVSKCNIQDIDNSVNNCSNSSDYKNSSFLGFNFYKKISDVFFIDFGFKKTKTNINPFIILRYNL